VLFDHDATVSGDSARFADFLATGDQEAMGGLCEGSGRLAYRSVTHPEAPPRAGRDLGATLASMPFSSDRAALAPYRGFRAIRSTRSLKTTRSATSPPASACPALVLERHLDGKPDCPAGTGLRDPQAWRPIAAAL
jgi:hypothetical protein